MERHDIEWFLRYGEGETAEVAAFLGYEKEQTMPELEILKELLAKGEFHHATYRNRGTCWEGLWIYRKSETGFRGYEVATCFNCYYRKGPHPDLEEAYRLVAHTGVSVGSYGRG